MGETMRGWWQDGGGKWHPPAEPQANRPLPARPALPPTAARPAPRTQPAKRKMRPFSWVILVVNVLLLIWIVAAVNGADCEREAELPGACEAGTAIGVGLAIFLWAMIDVILGVVWVVTNRNR